MKSRQIGSTIFLLFFLTACSNDRPVRPNSAELIGVTPIDKGDVPAGEVDSNEGSGDSKRDASELDFVPFQGSSMRLLDGLALTEVYKRVFKKSATGWRHCSKLNSDNGHFPQDFCHDSIFAANERKHVGITELFMPNSNRAASNIDAPSDLTLKSFRTLRSGVALECTGLVKTELQNLKAGASEKNVLIKSMAPKSTDLDEFFRHLIGMQGTGISVNIASADYVTAFEEIIKANAGADVDQDTESAFISLCLSISIDPQIILF